ncbi:uncharacterized protein LOC117176864 [Belonocnema kinseyi]|uniref:uncharacterized protein LOC117176864 n=1 Tax=Belonocnema kinseyi TaxID=2817044 RepID=UPI00143D4A96|nr:uncharacterized protein LOC117176864 [Belonocnema kinseyi]
MQSSSSSTKILKIVEGSENRKPVKFFIKEIPKNRYEDAADHMCTYFLADEAICKSTNVKDDPVAVKDFRSLFLYVLEGGLSVAAFVENPEDGKSTIAGLNILYRGGKEKDLEFQEFTNNFKSEKAKRILKVVSDTAAEVDAEKIYGTENYLGGLGLSVDPSFRGNGIGYHLLLARNEIGRKNGLVITITVFTSPISAKIADQAGFTILCEKLRDELVDEKGEILVPNCQSESFKCMGKRLE